MNLFWLLRKLVIFPIVFDGNPTHFIPEPTLVQRLFYIKTNDLGIDVVLQLYYFVIPLPATNSRTSQDKC